VLSASLVKPKINKLSTEEIVTPPPAKVSLVNDKLISFNTGSAAEFGIPKCEYEPATHGHYRGNGRPLKRRKS